jgi:hypothetical protein
VIWTSLLVLIPLRELARLRNTLDLSRMDAYVWRWIKGKITEDGEVLETLLLCGVADQVVERDVIVTTMSKQPRGTLILGPAAHLHGLLDGVLMRVVGDPVSYYPDMVNCDADPFEVAATVRGWADSRPEAMVFNPDAGETVITALTEQGLVDMQYASLSLTQPLLALHASSPHTDLVL